MSKPRTKNSILSYLTASKTKPEAENEVKLIVDDAVSEASFDRAYIVRKLMEKIVELSLENRIVLFLIKTVYYGYNYSPTPTSGHPSSLVAPCRRPVCAATVDKHYIMHPSLAVTPNFASQIGHARARTDLLSSAQDIIRTNVLTKFHEDHINSPPPDWNNFQLIQEIMNTNVLTKLYEDWTINVILRVVTSFY
ncbi:hypothetical protein DPMN_075610 [Dreissena polymorpha]|uniref:Uncharacterized protein n=1 Tax=Dreissena polymorpha TaxID=45954 RepID=A0A9D3YM15_DREPO|nr:hypothetical protein DPMN_075610 [Dreissena polymorpha]